MSKVSENALNFAIAIDSPDNSDIYEKQNQVFHSVEFTETLAVSYEKFKSNVLLCTWIVYKQRYSLSAPCQFSYEIR